METKTQFSEAVQAEMVMAPDWQRIVIILEDEKGVAEQIVLERAHGLGYRYEDHTEFFISGRVAGVAVRHED